MELTTVQKATMLAELRNELSITWTDADLDTKLSGFIAKGMAYLDDKTCYEQDYMIEGEAKSLLFDYARYARVGALKSFWEDYHHEILSLKAAGDMAAYETNLLVDGGM